MESLASPPIQILHGPRFSSISGTNLLGSLGGLAGLGATELLGGSILLGDLGAADSADAGNGLLADVSAVAVLGGLVGNTLVDPSEGQRGTRIGGIQKVPYLRVEVLGP